ncbi:GPW/gp25 family protein [Corallococcus sp. 4LFB]|uniref:GPW/gp25 family protein n=1 Tax=Corallococcus sp. 4LFB TaxID=3383249 RepID=UPI003976AB07
MERDFLGQGWSFPVRLVDGAVEQRGDAEKVQQSILLILGTMPGERVLQPEFGCGIHRLVFDTLDEATLGQAVYEVTLSLERWEHRIELNAVDARCAAEDPGTLLVSIDYTVSSTNSRFNLVYPFSVS